MSASFDNEEFPFGSARMAEALDAMRLGLFRKTDTAIYCGELGGRPLWYHGEGGVVLVAGARAGKLRDLLTYVLCRGTCDGRHIVMLDPKGEGAAISHNQVFGNGRAKKVVTFNPCGLHGLIRSLRRDLNQERSAEPERETSPQPAKEMRKQADVPERFAGRESPSMAR